MIMYIETLLMSEIFLIFNREHDFIVLKMSLKRYIDSIVTFYDNRLSNESMDLERW